MSLNKEALFDFFQAVIGTYSNSTLEFTKLSTTSSQLISVILWEFLPVVLFMSLKLDATLRVGGIEEKEEEEYQV